jgi:hypothetical protein
MISLRRKVDVRLLKSKLARRLARFASCVMFARMRFRFGVLILMAAMCTASAFSPYYANGQPARWDFNYTGFDPRAFNTTTKAIKFYIGNTATTANRTAELNAVRASFAQWQAISGTVLKFEEAGSAPASMDDFSRTAPDGTNSVFWTTKATVGGVDMTSRAAYTQVWFDAQNRIIEADTALNARIFSWFTDYNNTASGAQFVESIVLHEIGHFLGLDHTPVGGATVIDGGPGLGPAIGLSSDDIAAARFLYGAAGTLSQYGTIAGTVRMNGVGIHGAIVTAETPQGNVVSATATDSAGIYSMPALPPGAYNVHVSPMDPDSASPYESLFRAIDVAVDFGAAVINFKATENSPATVTANATTTLNFNVTSGAPAFRIQQISKPTIIINAPSPVRYGVGVNLGDTLYIGAAGSAIPADATLSVTGDGVNIGLMIYEPNRFYSTQNLVRAQITISSNATPGLRSIVVRRGTDIAYANGYLEIYPPMIDYNFDGLGDRFQRQYFPLWTAANAAPTADPDGDHFSNAFEALTGSNPTNAASYNFLIQQIEFVRGSMRVTWKSDVGKQYQLYGTADAAGSTWQLVGTPVTATTNVTSQTDSATGTLKIFKLRLLP